MGVRVQAEPFDIGQELKTIKGLNTQIGAVVSFTGLVRDNAGGSGLKSMTLEHYPGMTETELKSLEQEANERWPLQGSLIVHRYGTLKPGEDIVLVITASAHREAAFAAAQFLMDCLKSRVPFWKKEERGDGGAQWVDAKACDDTAQSRWKSS